MQSRKHAGSEGSITGRKLASILLLVGIHYDLLHVRLFLLQVLGLLYVASNKYYLYTPACSHEGTETLILHAWPTKPIQLLSDTISDTLEIL